MKLGAYRFDRIEFAGSLGDLGTLIPLSIALITVTHLNFTTVFLLVGLFYLATGLYYRRPIPVQPLKVVSAIAIAFPEKISLSVMSATGLLFGALLIFLACTGIIDRLAKFFTKPIVRWIQLGLGFILVKKGISFIRDPGLFLHETGDAHLVVGVPIEFFYPNGNDFLTALFLPVIPGSTYHRQRRYRYNRYGKELVRNR